MSANSVFLNQTLKGNSFTSPVYHITLISFAASISVFYLVTFGYLYDFICLYRVKNIVNTSKRHAELNYVKLFMYEIPDILIYYQV